MKTTVLTTVLSMLLSMLAALPFSAVGALPPVDTNYDGDVDGSDLAEVTFNNGTDILYRFAATFGSKENFSMVYEVGPDQDYSEPNNVPWESLEPGSLVRIHYRALPYANKWVIAVAGTTEAPIVVRGIPQDGELPVITGENATTREALNYWNESRSVIKVGGSSYPSETPAYITIENLDIHSARPAYSFTDDQGNMSAYSSNAAAIHVEAGNHVTIRNCILHDCGNGFFAGSTSSDLLLESNYIYDNGIADSGYHHNNYTECLGITFQYNHFGPLRDGCKGNNLKDRSAGTTIRYNWIEAGNRTLDLVDSDHDSLIQDTSYGETFVYGNVLIKHDVQENGQVLHYGGDSGDTGNYRKGTLWFYNNTVVSYRSGNTTLMRLSTNAEHAECFNNIVLATAGSGRLAILDAAGTIDLYNNWLSENWVDVHGTLTGTINSLYNLAGTNPGFMEFSTKNYHLSTSSDCVDEGAGLPSDLLPTHSLDEQYVMHQDYTIRSDDTAIDIGAFETENN